MIDNSALQSRCSNHLPLEDDHIELPTTGSSWNHLYYSKEIDTALPQKPHNNVIIHSFQYLPLLAGLENRQSALTVQAFHCLINHDISCGSVELGCKTLLGDSVGARTKMRPNRFFSEPTLEILHWFVPASLLLQLY